MTAPTSAVQKLVERWRARAHQFTAAAEPHPADAVGALWHRHCADDLDRLDREVLQPAREALRDAYSVLINLPDRIEYGDGIEPMMWPRDIVDQVRAALAKLDGKEAEDGKEA